QIKMHSGFSKQRECHCDSRRFRFAFNNFSGCSQAEAHTISREFAISRDGKPRALRSRSIELTCDWLSQKQLADRLDFVRRVSCQGCKSSPLWLNRDIYAHWL